MTKEKCTQGMVAYLETFENGTLVSLAKTVGDGGQYLNVLRRKFDADAANWVWNVETAQQKIREVILEYQIIVESNKIISKSISYDATIREWCDKCGYIRISYAAAKNYLDELGPFLGMLYNLKKQERCWIPRSSLSWNLFRQTEAHSATSTTTRLICSTVCADTILMGFQKTKSRMCLTRCLLAHSPTKKADYLNQVEAKVGAYKEGQKNTQLKKLWREKTGTDSPRDWSKKHKMPILCLIPDNEVAKAKAAFGAVNRAKADEQAIDRAMEYFASAKFFDLLDDSAALDKAFRDSIIGNYAVMLLNIQEVKDYLDSHITAEPFEWFGLPEIEKKLRQMAEAKYNQGGCERALAKIDEMDIADVKKYLKDLIRDNMVVGMEIIKGN